MRLLGLTVLIVFAAVAAVAEGGEMAQNPQSAALDAAKITCRVDSFYSMTNVTDRSFLTASPEAAAAGCPAFVFEDLSHPKLAELRSKYHLDEIVAPGKDEIEKMALMTSWVKSRWEHKKPRIFPKWDALEMLELAEKGEKFYCVQSSILLIQCLQAVGFQARKLEIHTASGADHSVIDVWAPDHGKWVVMDPDYNIHYLRAGEPLGALELHDAGISGQVDDIEMVRGPCPYEMQFSKGTELYRHVYVVWRNDFLSRPDAPVRLVHFTDEKSPSQLMDDGKLLFADPTLFGPHNPYRDGKPDYMRPFSLDTRVTLDGNDERAWMADDNGSAHFVEFLFDEPQALSQVVVKWPQVGGVRVAPKAFTVLTRENGQWRPLINGDLNAEEAQFPLTLPLPEGRFEGLRIECPADESEKGAGPSFGVAEIEFYAL